MIYRIDNFTECAKNPITGQYFDDTWMVYCLTESNDYQMMVGNSNQLVYTVKVSKNYTGWEMSVCDFIEFHKERNKNVILSITEEDFKTARQLYKGHKYNDAFLREEEPDILIHSTTHENWIGINHDRCLKSWNILNDEKQGWEEFPIGQRLGDPMDFRDFIMFSSGSISGELVVLSKQKKKISMNHDTVYETGARLYFDSKKIAEDGLLIRDGIHLKVMGRLPLEPYLLWCATWDKIGLDSSTSTPKEFTEQSNRIFNQLFNRRVITTF